jgi:hypothetical protein
MRRRAPAGFGLERRQLYGRIGAVMRWRFVARDRCVQ